MTASCPRLLIRALEAQDNTGAIRDHLSLMHKHGRPLTNIADWLEEAYEIIATPQELEALFRVWVEA